MRKESDITSVKRREPLEEMLRLKQEESAELTARWEKERAEIETLKRAKADLEQVRLELDQAQREGKFGEACELRYSKIPELEKNLRHEGNEESLDGRSDGLPHDSVTPDDIANVDSRSTGIPVQRLMSGEMEKLVHMEDTLRKSMRGQDEALHAVSNAVRQQRAGLSGENRPISIYVAWSNRRGENLFSKDASFFPFLHRIGSRSIRHERIFREAYRQ